MGMRRQGLASTAGLITGEQLKDLPLNGRSFHELMTLNTHTVDNRSNSGSASFSVAGKRTENNRWTIKGMDYVATMRPVRSLRRAGRGQLLGVEAIREFKLRLGRARFHERESTTRTRSYRVKTIAVIFFKEVSALSARLALLRSVRGIFRASIC